HITIDRLILLTKFIKIVKLNYINVKEEKMISKNMLISEVIKKFPTSKKVFDDFNMGCLSCMGIQNETIEKGCMMHGIDPEELIKAIEDLIKNSK
ncbi:MAG: DUF1858 domain-containing protein, partial [Calditerrivibrio sp.]|nr:DUF1858 domain-containing protein [Calditerrivibrio sp.]